MKHCKYCGAQLADDEAYCYFCGKPTETEEEIIEEKEEQPIFHDQSYYEDKTTYNRQQINTVAMLGLVFAFISPIVGLILSIIGLNKSRQLNGLGRDLAIAGIIVSIVSMVLSLVLYMYLISLYGTEGAIS